MHQHPETCRTLPLEAVPAVSEITRGMKLKKCRKCGCMKDALDQAERAFATSNEEEIRSLVPLICEYRSKMEPLAYDCIGCKKCWGADATIALAAHFDEVEIGSCGGEDEQEPCQAVSKTDSWPPYPGDYILGNPQGTVAVCTLSDRNLPGQLITAGEAGLAIAGRCDTENIGIEKVVLNLLANARIRWLVICGEEAKGHRAGDAFLQLKERGVDTSMRVLESASWRPVLRNLTLLHVARFREQIEEVNLIGVTDVDRILAKVRECSSKPVQAHSSAFIESNRSSELLPGVEHIRSEAPKQLRLDCAGFFIILPQQHRGVILCEHYENDGRLAHVIEGRQAALIAATVVERGLVTQLDHAAYLGRELQKAEAALIAGGHYEQDAALGTLNSSQEKSESNKTNEIERKPILSTSCAC